MSAEDFNTRELVGAAQAGDETASDRLFRRYYPWVLQVSALRMGEPLRAVLEREDLVQEALLDAFRGLARFEHRDEGSFRNWLATIVSARVRDGWRRETTLKRSARKTTPFAGGASSVLTASLFPDAGASPSEHAAANELEERIETAMLAMPPRERSAVELRRLCGLEYAAIATELELPTEGAARALVARALTRLAEAL